MAADTSITDNTDLKGAGKYTLKKNLLPHDFGWYAYIFFSAAVSFVFVGLSYLIGLLSKIAIDKQHQLISYTLLYLAVWIILSILTRIGYLYCRKRAFYEWNCVIKSQLMHRILYRSFSAFKKYDRAYYVSLFNNDIPFLEENLLEARVRIYSYSTMLAGAAIYSLTINVFLTILILLSSIGSFYLSKGIASYSRKYNKKYMESLGAYNEDLDDAVRGYSALYHSNGVLFFLSRFMKKTEGMAKDSAQSLFANGAVVNLLNQVSQIVQMVLCLVFLYMAFRGNVKGSSFLVFLTIMNMMNYPVSVIMTAAGSVKGSRDIQTKLLRELETPQEETEASFQMGMSAAASAELVGIQVRDLSFSYGERTIYKKVSLEFLSGEHILIQGKSGSGKSTLMRLLTREIMADSGEILVNGGALAAIPRSTLFQMISVVSQQPMLFRATILDNITMFQKESAIDRQRMDKAVESAGLTEFIASLADGLHTVLVDSGDNLSGGEKQRIQLARAVYYQSKVLLVDEVTSGLDLEKALEIEQILRRLDQIVIAVSHRKDIRLEEYYDKIYYLENGSFTTVKA